MKKTFSFEDPKIKPDRLVEAARAEIKKYIARERRKELPEGFDIWTFDCKFGTSAEDAEVIQESEIKNSITRIAADNYSAFYIEILAKPAKKNAQKD